MCGFVRREGSFLSGHVNRYMEEEVFVGEVIAAFKEFNFGANHIDSFANDRCAMQ